MDRPENVVEQWPYAHGTLARERVTRDGELLVERWYDESGRPLAEVVPDGELERWLGYDTEGTIIVEGDLERGAYGRPIGAWDLYDPDGTHVHSESFAEFTINRDPHLTEYVQALYAWRTAPVSAELFDADDVDWPDLSAMNVGVEHIPFLLSGLTQPDDWAFSLALGQLRVVLGSEGQVVEATGPAFRFLARLVDRVEAGVEARTELLEFLAEAATGGGAVDVVSQVLAVHAELPGDGTDPRDFYERHDVDPDYAEVYAVLAETVGTWARLATDPVREIRHWGITLLAASPGPEADRALRSRLLAEPDRRIRAEILLALGMHGAECADLRPYLHGDDPLLRFCAASTWIRKRLKPEDDALRTLRGHADLVGYEGLFYGSGDPLIDVEELVELKV